MTALNIRMVELKTQLRAESGASWIVLFTTTGTLVCCALPIALVTLGMGAAVASLTNSFPILITLSQHKTWVFGFSGLMLAASGWLVYRPDRTCPSEPELAAACNRVHIWNVRLFWGSVAVWSVGFFAAFLLLPLRRLMGW